MSIIKPFKAYRPASGLESTIAALPYDVYNRQEATAVVHHNPDSFLAIDRAETGFCEQVDTYAPEVYDKARELLRNWIQEGKFIQDETPSFYLYELTMGERSQTGIVACASVDDYLNNIIKKHENTRADKEADRIRHVDTTNMQTGPIFLAYKSNPVLSEMIFQIKQTDCSYDFVSEEDGIRHRGWIINDVDTVELIRNTFDHISELYIADGHHRCASAVKVGLKRREQYPDFDGTEEFNYFLSVLFDADELKIMDYNRVVKDLNGYSSKEFIEKISENFMITTIGKNVYQPQQKASFGMFLEGCWYRLDAKEHILSNDPIAGLDVSILQDHLLNPILGIQEPKTDKRIDFVGGIRGLSELERRVHTDMKVAFSMYPTSMDELFAVADAGLLMPPKSTWFEPKLRSGLYIHSLD